MTALALSAALAQALIRSLAGGLAGIAAAVVVALSGAWLLARLDAQKRQDLVVLATHDGLTGLANRNYFLDRAAEAIAMAQRARTRLALIFLDVDMFKQINDRHGHASGDALLAEIGRRLPPLLRAGDVAARIAGDEFALLVNAVGDDNDAETVRARINEAMQRSVDTPGGAIAVRLSCGVAYFPDDGADVDTLLSVADDRMYADKSSHREPT